MSATDAIIRKIRAMGYSVTLFRSETGVEIHALRLRDSYRLVVRDCTGSDATRHAASTLLQLVTNHAGVTGTSPAERRAMLSANQAGRRVSRASVPAAADRQ